MDPDCTVRIPFFRKYESKFTLICGCSARGLVIFVLFLFQIGACIVV